MNQKDGWRVALRRVDDWNVFSKWILAALCFVVGFLYWPILNANFQGDDYGLVGYLFFNWKTLLQGQGWDALFISVPWLKFLPYLRPGLHLFDLLDFTAYGLNPLGYHVTNLILHVLTAFLLVLLAWLLTRDRLVAAAAGLLFAIMPIHVETVSWLAARADGLGAVWYLIAVVFFILFRKRGRLTFLAVSLVAFAMGLAVKETGITVPVILIVYDVLYTHPINRRMGQRMLVEHSVFWGVALVYLGLRSALLGSLGTGIGFDPVKFPWDYQSQVFALGMADPFFSDMTGALRSVILGLGVLALVLYRSRRQVWFGAAWAVLTLVPSLLSANATIFDRYLYLPTVGLALLLAGILSRPSLRFARLSRVLAPVGLGVLVVVYGYGLYTRNEAWGRAALITQAVSEQMRSLHPALPADARLVFTNVPVLVGGRQMQAFGNMLPTAMHVLYHQPQLQVYNVSKFPIWTDKLDRTYFFEYDRRKLTERADLVAALRKTSLCSGVSFPAVTWDFSQDAQGWEPWNQLAGFEVHDSVLTMRSEGPNPSIGGPAMDVPAMAIGQVTITLRVRANRSGLQGALYWLASDQQDFSPALKQTFDVKADGAFHTYNADIGQSGMLLIGDHIRQLRLDPIDGPGDIDLKSIQVSVHCKAGREETCGCGPD